MVVTEHKEDTAWVLHVFFLHSTVHCGDGNSDETDCDETDGDERSHTKTNGRYVHTHTCKEIYYCVHRYLYIYIYTVNATTQRSYSLKLKENNESNV